MSRKTPVLLRRGPISGRIDCLTNYRRVAHSGPENYLLSVATNGKHDVTADFDALVCEGLLDKSDLGAASPDIVAILDGAARGLPLDDAERAQARAFRERLRALIERHNTQGHGVGGSAA